MSILCIWTCSNVKTFHFLEKLRSASAMLFASQLTGIKQPIAFTATSIYTFPAIFIRCAMFLLSGWHVCKSMQERAWKRAWERGYQVCLTTRFITMNILNYRWIFQTVNEYFTTWRHTKPTSVRNKPGYIKAVQRLRSDSGCVAQYFPVYIVDCWKIFGRPVFFMWVYIYTSCVCVCVCVVSRTIEVIGFTLSNRLHPKRAT